VLGEGPSESDGLDQASIVVVFCRGRGGPGRNSDGAGPSRPAGRAMTGVCVRVVWVC
jgi:hypothetical protein